MASFNLQESISYCSERNTKLFVAFMDTKKAFDVVWHKGLFVKLSNFGVSLKMIRIIMNMYENRTASVYDGGMTSQPFSICRGTAQGGILSPWLYLVFVNDLLILLSDSNDGLRIGNRSLACPTQADNIALLI